MFVHKSWSFFSAHWFFSSRKNQHKVLHQWRKIIIMLEWAIKNFAKTLSGFPQLIRVDVHVEENNQKLRQVNHKQHDSTLKLEQLDHPSGSCLPLPSSSAPKLPIIAWGWHKIFHLLLLQMTFLFPTKLIDNLSFPAAGWTNCVQRDRFVTPGQGGTTQQARERSTEFYSVW